MRNAEKLPPCWRRREGYMVYVLGGREGEVAGVEKKVIGAKRHFTWGDNVEVGTGRAGEREKKKTPFASVSGYCSLRWE